MGRPPTGGGGLVHLCSRPSRLGFFMSVSETTLLQMAQLHASDALKRRWPNRYVGKPILGMKDCVRGLIEMGALDEKIVDSTTIKAGLIHWLLAHMHARKSNPAYDDASFYRSAAWRKLRFSVLQASSGCCVACGARGSDGVRLHVDHIKPRSKYPELALDAANLQVLCEDCNVGKADGLAVAF